MALSDLKPHKTFKSYRESVVQNLVISYPPGIFTRGYWEREADRDLPFVIESFQQGDLPMFVAMKIISHIADRSLPTEEQLREDEEEEARKLSRMGKGERAAYQKKYTAENKALRKMFTEAREEVARHRGRHGRGQS